MFIKLLKKLFTPTRQKDEHLSFYEDTAFAKPEIAVLKCTTHIKFKKSCPICLKANGYG
tara:strand:- start:489 stop:665 length:177 start_codon:yes stop_codon:yes gene_type:complete